MLNVCLIALVTGALWFALSAVTGFGASPNVVTMTVGQIASFPSDNFHGQAVSATQVACGAKVAPGTVQVQVYYTTHQLEVIKFGKTLARGTILLNVRR
jgi:hypothetical protein